MTLDEFNERIMKPSLIKAIKEGSLDNALADADCMDIIMADPELKNAAVIRIKEIFK